MKKIISRIIICVLVFISGVSFLLLAISANNEDEATATTEQVIITEGTTVTTTPSTEATTVTTTSKPTTTETTTTTNTTKKETTKSTSKTSKKKKSQQKKTTESSKGDWIAFTATAYCNCSKCCGSYAGGRTASGVYPKANHTIAVDTSVIPLGTSVKIKGYGTYVAEDTGSAIKGRKIDIYFDSHSEALNFGRRTVYLQTD